LSEAERLYDQIISLPLYPRMTEADVQDVLTAVTDVVRVSRR
jgi:dTDP-4-amino-4,6-dideoxygalactose transaminase